MNDIPIYKGKSKNIVVISGGGIKGFCILGTIKKLIELNIISNPDIYCGTSVGACISILLLIGYLPDDIYEVLKDIDFSMLIDYNEDLLDDSYIGIIKSDPIMSVISTMLKRKGIDSKITFRELFIKFKKKLIITGVCLNDLTINYFNYETYPDMNVLKAVRISMSIPFIFKPVKFNGKLWVDGGCLNNYPIDVFDNVLDDVIGIYAEDDVSIVDDFEDKITYGLQVFKCILKGLNIYKKKIYEKYTIIVKPTCEGQLFNIEDENKKIMFDCGYNCNCDKFIN